MNVLVVDDHLMTIEGYISLLKKEIPKFTTFKALNCMEAYRHITSTTNFDLAIIDYQLPEFEEKKLNSGMDVALLLRKHHLECKIMMITAYEEAAIIYNIYRKVQPNALIIKSDISYTSFKGSLHPERRYLSPTAQKAISIINNNQGLFNDVNREILLYLRLGYKLDEIGTALSLSESTIQKRVAKMRTLFNVNDINGLIKEVIKQGIV